MSVKGLKYLLDKFNVRYHHCVDKLEIKNLVKYDIFYNNRSSKNLKEYLTSLCDDCSNCVKRYELFKLVTMIKLTKRIYHFN